MSSRRLVGSRHDLQSDSYTSRGSTSSSAKSRKFPVATLPSITDESNSQPQTQARVANSRSLPSPLDQIDPNRWKHFPRLSTTSDFASFPFSEIEMYDEEAQLSADEHSIVGTKPDVQEDVANDEISMPTTPETRLRGTAAGIRRAVSDSSDKIKRMTLKLRRAPSALLSRSRSRVFNANSPLATKICQKQELLRPSTRKQRSESCQLRQDEVEPRDVGFSGKIKATSISIACVEGNKEKSSLVSSLVMQPFERKKPWANSLQARPSTTLSQRFMSDYKPAKYYEAAQGTTVTTVQNEARTVSIQKRDAAVLINEAPLSGSGNSSQVGSLPDESATYPQEPLKWLEKDLLVNGPLGLSNQASFTNSHDIVIQMAMPSRASPLANCGGNGSIPQIGLQVVWDKQQCLPMSPGQSRTHGHDTRELIVYPNLNDTNVLPRHSSTSKRSFDLSALTRHRSIVSSNVKDGKSRAVARSWDSLGRSWSRAFRGADNNFSKENQKP
ncbi:hypothetical protein H2198_000108 [Neophaeococcomyces mojaviensis]|uniref:Uncharacterized protein n=1 Tax=Neophaeococcomyces mojaviensis TaxID=3383035 RepID=A0ACC3AL12_9EURO|nr:hypothetical protein H2198_000108 [Knufia sp. JES_112]